MPKKKPGFKTYTFGNEPTIEADNTTIYLDDKSLLIKVNCRTPIDASMLLSRMSALMDQYGEFVMKFPKPKVG